MEDFGRRSTLAGRFLLRRQLGAGGMGIVYEAVDQTRDMVVALKTLPSHEPEHLRLFKNEFRSLCDIVHPNLVRMFEMYADPEGSFFTMELVDGSELLDVVRPGTVEAPRTTAPTHAPVAASDGGTAVTVVTGPYPSGDHAPRSAGGKLDTALVHRVMAEVAQGIHALHAHGKVHRDIKPRNVMVARSGRVVLLDYGLVADQSLRKDGKKVLRGTPAYMAPEQEHTSFASPAADWYSFGVLLYQCLTGELPHRGADILELLRRKHEEPVPPPWEVDADAPRDLGQLALDLLRADPDARPGGDDVLRRLAARGTTEVSWTAVAGATLVGRAAELAALHRDWDRFTRGETRIVVLQGESGIGKSLLFEQFAAALEAEHGALVLRGRCYERERVSFNALDGVVEGLAGFLGRLEPADATALLPERASLLGRLFPALARVAPAAAAPDDHTAKEQRRLSFRALSQLLGNVARTRPLVLAIDDAHWADRDSRGLLAELLGPGTDAPLFVLASVRAQPDATQAHPFDGEVSIVPVVALGELESLDVIRQLPEARSWPEATLRQLAREANGHPMLLLELARHAARHGEPDRVPTLHEALWTRIAALSDEAREPLAVLCIADSPVPQEILALAARQPLGQLTSNLLTLRAVALARVSGTRRSDVAEPYHDQVRQAFLPHLDAERTAELHERLALAFIRIGADQDQPERVIEHLARAGRRAQAAHRALAAGERAYRNLAFDLAAHLLLRAEQLGDHAPEALARIRFQRAEALADGGRGAAAAAAYQEAAPFLPRDAAFLCAQRAAEQLLVSGQIKPGVEALQKLLAEVDLAFPATSRSALARLAVNRLRLPFAMRRARRPAPAAAPPPSPPEALLHQIDVLRAASRGLGMVDNIRGAHFQTLASLLALRSGDRFRIAITSYYEACFRGSQGPRGRASAQTFIRLADEASDQRDFLRAWEHATKGVCAYFGGEFDEAIGHFHVAIDALSRVAGATWDLNNVRLFRLWALLRLGDYPQLRELAEDQLRDADNRDDLYTATTIRRCCNRVWLMQDAPHLARRELERASWDPAAQGFHLQHWYSLRAETELALYEDRVAERYDDLEDRYARLGRSMLLRVQTIRTEAFWLRGRLAVAAGGKRGVCQRMARSLHREEVGYARVWAALLDAADARAHARPDAVAQHLASAARHAREQRMALCEVVAEGLHARLGLPGAPSGAAERAAAWYEAQGIVAPRSVERLIAPGLSETGRLAAAR